MTRANQLHARFGPFTGGINRLLARTKLSPGELWDAQGVVQVERGRLRSCWEGKNAEATLTNLTDGTSQLTQAPERAVYFKIGADLLILNNYRADFAVNSGLIVSKASGAGWAASTKYYIGDVVYGVATSTDIPFECVDFSGATDGGTSGASEPTWDTDYMAETTDNTVTWRPLAKRAWAIEYLDYIVIFVDRETARVVHKDTLGDSSVQFDDSGGGAITDVSTNWVVKHSPIWMYKDWWDVRTEGGDDPDKLAVSESSTLLTLRGTKVDTDVTHGARDDQGPHGANGAAIASYITTGYRYKSASDSLDALPTRGLACQANSTNGDDLGIDGKIITTSTDAEFYARIGYCHQQLFGRNPAIFKGRLCFVEARDWEYSRLNLGAGARMYTRKSGGQDRLYVTPASIDDVRAGDQVIVYFEDDGVAPTGGADPNTNGVVNTTDIGHDVNIYKSGFSAATQTAFKYDVTSSNLTSSASSTVDFTVSPDHVFTLPTGTAPNDFAGYPNGGWVRRRPLTEAQKRTIFFLGRPANVSVGISAETRDFLWLNNSNSVVIGDPHEGAIVGLYSQGDNRLLVGMESSIYEIVGNLPLDGTAPPGFDVRRVTGSAGIYADTAATFDDTGQVLYFCSGTDNGMYRLYGQTVERIDDKIREHPSHPNNASAPTGFSHVTLSNKRLYCQTDETAPTIWILDLLTGSWTYTQRVNSGQGQQQSDGAALELSDGSYASNNLYNGSGSHGGIFSPYRSAANEPDRVLVSYSDGTDYKLRTMNYMPDEHNESNLLHGVKVQTGYIDGGSQAPKRIRQIRVLNTKPLVDDNGGAAFTEARVSATSSEGETTLSRDVTPDWTDSQGDSDKYRVQGVGGRGDTSVSVTVNDGISPMGEIDSIEIDLFPMEHRAR